MVDRAFKAADQAFKAADQAFEKAFSSSGFSDMPKDGEGIEEEKTVEETRPDGTKIVTKTVIRRWRG